jgi:hypothetical protein
MIGFLEYILERGKDREKVQVLRCNADFQNAEKMRFVLLG